MDEQQKELLIRLDERTDMIWKHIQLFEKRFVSRADFWPVKTIVYSGAGIALVGVAGAIVGLVIIK